MDTPCGGPPEAVRRLQLRQRFLESVSLLFPAWACRDLQEGLLPGRFPTPGRLPLGCYLLEMIGRRSKEGKGREGREGESGMRGRMNEPPNPAPGEYRRRGAP